MAVSDSKNIVTVERLNAVIAGENGVWSKTKGLISELDGIVTGTAGAGKTLTAFSQTDGNVTATFGNISITKNQVSDFPASMPPSSHTHGYINDDGTLSDTAGAAAGDDYVVIRDASTNKVQTSTIKGTDVADAVSKKHSHSDITLSTTATDYDGTHTIALPSSDPYSSARTPTSHASSTTSYGVGTTENYGHVKLASGDLNGQTATDGYAASNAHSHSQYAPKASPELTGTPTAPTASSGTNTTQIATTAFVKAEIESVLDAADAMRFKGTIGSSGATVSSLPAAHKAGDTYKVSTAGTYAGKVCEIGDMILCIKDGSTSSDADWTVVQNNIDGAVTGPASSVDAHIAVFDGASGKTIKDSGTTVSDFATSSHDHDSVYLKPVSGTITLVSNSAVKIGTLNSNDVKLQLPTIPAAANNGALKISLNGGSAASKFTANQSTDSTLTFGEGSTNGTIAVDGTDVAVHGLGSAAYTKSTDYATSSHTHGNISNDGKVGTTADLPLKTTTGGSVAAGAWATSSSAVSSSASAGSEATFSRGDHTHSISVATGDSAGQVKIAGQNASVNGWTDKANLASPAFTGTPTAPTATAGTNSTQIATTAFVQNSIPVAITAADVNDIWNN